MASSLVEKNCVQMRESRSKDLTRCHRRHSIFLITMCCVLATILLAGMSFSTQTVSASSSSTGGNSGYECTFYVRSGIGYGVILSSTGNTSSPIGSGVKFTFTYNYSINDVASRLSIYSYSDGLYITQLNESSVLALEYRDSNPAYYAVKMSGIDLCKIFVQESVVTPSGDEYRKVTVSTGDDAGWSSGYYVGQGATVVILGEAGSGRGSSGKLVNGWDLNQVGNVAIAVAITVSSLIPFFIVLPDAVKTLSDNVAARKARRGDGGDLYLSILSVFIPLLCICIAIVSTTAMLSLLNQPIT